MGLQKKIKLSNNRNSSIELLKVVAIFFIILSHTTLDLIGYGSLFSHDISMASSNPVIVINTFIHQLGMLGDTIFFACSAWFLIDDDSIKEDKILKIVADNWFFCIVWMLSAGIVLHAGYNYLFSQLTPLISVTNWFVPAYIVFYVLHPLMNRFIRSVDKRKLVIIISFFFFVFTIYYFYRPTNNQFYTRVIGAELIYLIVSYIKLYANNGKENRGKQTLEIVLLSILFIARCFMLNVFGLHFSFLSTEMLRFDTFTDPIFIGITILLLKNSLHYNYRNSLINWLSSLSLLVYVVHGNRIAKHFLYPKVFLLFSDYYNWKNILLFQILFAFAVFVVSVVISQLYLISISKYVRRTVYAMYGLIKRFFLFIIDRSISR